MPNTEYYLDLFSKVNLPKLDLGCGSNKQKGFIGVDKSTAVNPDVVANLEKPLPFDDNSIGGVFCDQCLEHIRRLIPLMNECHRILVPGALMWIGVPRFPEPESVIDPFHVRFFVAGTFDYFCSPSSKFNYGISYWEKVEVTTPAWGVTAVLRKPE